MAADLHIHVFEDGTLTEDHFRATFSNTFGSKWALPLGDRRACIGHPWQKQKEALEEKAESTPNVGSVRCLG